MDKRMEDKKLEKQFYNQIKNLVNNLIVNNINYKNGYYYDKSLLTLIEETKERGKYILEKMETTKHLIGLENDSN